MMHMKCQALFALKPETYSLRKNIRKNTVSLLSADFTERVIEVKYILVWLWFQLRDTSVSLSSILSGIFVAI